MEQIQLHNFRCFREEQTAHLGRLTLLVGENSTGKTSFLALVRALWHLAFHEAVPNFREPPYDLGRFREIAHHRGARGSSATTFSAGFTDLLRDRGSKKWEHATFTATFSKHDTAPFPAIRRLSSGRHWIEHRLTEAGKKTKLHGMFHLGTPHGSWELPLPNEIPFVRRGYLFPFDFLPPIDAVRQQLKSCEGTTDPLADVDYDTIRHLIWRFQRSHAQSTPYAGAPVRSRPMRTYDPITFTPDPEGEYIPLYLANLRSGSATDWASLKYALESFGRDAGLFDDIDVKLLGGVDGGAFELRIRKSGRRLKGPRRNLADLGYGISQVLPIVTELLKKDPQPLFLLQQPEVHLHPSAQAALGGLLCSIAARKQIQLIIETHSDHLIDRIRMDVRDRRTKLLPEDVSILYFEARGLDVQIHTLRLDSQGNVLHAPDSYRQFFLTETQRSLGL